MTAMTGIKRVGRAHVLVRRYLAIAFAIVSTAAAFPAASFALSDYPYVSTWAGTGAAGIRDGAARNAEFVAPYGIAFDAAGNLYVADAGAQRIRRISRDGIVSLLAGAQHGVLPQTSRETCAHGPTLSKEI